MKTKQMYAINLTEKLLVCLTVMDVLMVLTVSERAIQSCLHFPFWNFFCVGRNAERA